MKYTKWILAAAVGFALQGAAVAQIYESEDAEGVPDFSDTPSAGAEVVDLPATNLAEPPPDIPDAPQETQESPPPSGVAVDDGEQSGSGDAIYYGGDEDEDVRAQRREDAARINNALPGEPGVGVGAPGLGVEPGVGVGEPGAGIAEPHEVPHEGGMRR